MNDFIVYAITVIFSVLVGMALGFCLRSHSVDGLRAEIVQLKAARDGRQIRTSKATEAPVRPPARPAGTRRPTMTPGHAAVRTEPLPPEIRYTAQGIQARTEQLEALGRNAYPSARPDGDDPISDEEYAERYARNT